MKTSKFLSICLFFATVTLSCTRDEITPDKSSEDLNKVLEEATSTGEERIIDFQAFTKNRNKSQTTSKQVGILGAESEIIQTNWENLLMSNGDEVTIVDHAFMADGGLAKLDVLLYLRYGGEVAKDYVPEITKFVNNGGVLLTEYTATTYVLDVFSFSSVDSEIIDKSYFSPSGSVDGGNNILITAPAHPLATNLPSSFVSGDQFGAIRIYNVLDPNFTTVATLDHDVNRDGQNDPVVSTMCIGDGVWIAFFSDFGDLSGNNNVDEERRMSLNAVNLYQADYDGDGIGDVCDPDDDNDGVSDELDKSPNSNTETSVNIKGCDSGVENQLLDDGIYMSDLIDELETGAYKNLGQEVSSYNHLVNDWVQKNKITAAEKNAIQNCVK